MQPHLERSEHVNILDLGAGLVPDSRWRALLLRLLLRVVGARAPRREDALPADVQASPERFGPFMVGDLVRVHATANAWFVFGDAGVTVAKGAGVPLGAWEGLTMLVSDEGARYVSMLADAGGSPVYALAWRTGNVLQEGV